MSEKVLKKIDNEVNKLEKKVVKLMKFLDSNNFKAMNDVEQKLMEIQASSMTTYLFSLNARYEYIEARTDV